MYQLGCLDGRLLVLHRSDFSILKQMKAGPVGNPDRMVAEHNLHRYVIYRCIVGSRAYGLNHDDSDFDRRGIYLPPAELHWSLYGVPEQLEDASKDECYWELGKFISLALRANPNILECLYTPMVEYTNEISEELLARKAIFLSKLVYQTYNGYVMSQFKKLEQDLRTTGALNWKHAMHLVRLLLQGIDVLREKFVTVSVEQYRDELLQIRNGQRSWADVNEWRLRLHREFDQSLKTTGLPDTPDYEEANRLLVWARRKMVETRADS